MGKVADAYGRFVTRNAACIMLGMLAIVIAAVVTLVSVGIELDTQNAFESFGNDVSNTGDSQKLARENNVFSLDSIPLSKDTEEPQQSVSVHSVTMIFKSRDGDDGNLLTVETLEAIKEYEDSVLDIDRWDDFCLLDDNDSSRCSPFTSITNYIYPSFVNGSAQPIFDGRGDLVADPLATIASLPQELTTSLLSSEYLEDGTAHAILTSFPIAYPLEGYTKPYDEDGEVAEMNDEYNSWSNDVFAVFTEDREEANADARGFQILFLGTSTIGVGGVTESEFLDTVSKDGLKAAGSLVVVFLYMWYHTKSPALTALGMFHILMALPLALFINRVIIGVKLISFLQFLGVFIILGIGADDIFIMLDAWKQSALHDELGGHAEKRASWAISRAAKAMAISSATTAAAFYVNALSSIPAVAFFGIFTGSLVLMNYWMVVTWFPAAIILHHRVQRYGYLSLFKSRSALKASKVKPENLEAGKESAAPVIEMRALERFFRDSFVPFVYRNRVAILVAFMAVIISSTFFAVQLSPAENPGQFLPDDANLQDALTTLSDDFGSASVPPTAFIMFGVTGIDREGVDVTDLSFLGVEQYYDDFDPGTIEAQDFIMDLCAELRTFDWVVETVTGTEGNLTATKDVGCFLEDVYDFLNESSTYRIPPADFNEVIANWTSATEAELRTVREPSGDSRPTEWVGFDPETLELAYVAIAVNLTLPGGDFVQAVDSAPVFDEVEEWMSEVNAESPDSLGPGAQYSATWIRMRTEQTLIRSAVQGAFISLAATFVVMLISTQGFLLSFWVTLTVGLIFLSLMAAMVLIGWTLGIIESVALTVTVGLSVDYAVHLANSYHESPAPTRYLRLQQGLTEMGISVFSSAVTTVGSSAVLFFTIIAIFQRFGSFIVIVISLSFLYAFFFWVALSAVIGPKDDSLWSSPLPLDLSGDHRYPEKAGSLGMISWPGANGDPAPVIAMQ